MTRPARQTRIDIEALKRERPLADVIASYGIELRREGNGDVPVLLPISPGAHPELLDRRSRHRTTSTTTVLANAVRMATCSRSSWSTKGARSRRPASV